MASAARESMCADKMQHCRGFIISTLEGSILMAGSILFRILWNFSIKHIFLPERLVLELPLEPSIFHHHLLGDLFIRKPPLATFVCLSYTCKSNDIYCLC